MSVLLQSDNITLLSEYGYRESQNELWKVFRRTAVEPGQASSPDLDSFADECLIYAHVMVKLNAPSTTDETRNNEPLLDTHTPERYTPTSLPPPSAEPPPPPDPACLRVGFVYLYAGPANLPAGEANIGIIIRQDMQRRGYARETVQLVLRWAFEELKFHRVQAAILDTPFKDRALRLFIGLGFAHEGTKRRAVYQPEGEGMAGVWKDVTYLAMLDTEWMLRSTRGRGRDSHVLDQPVAMLWDEMFARHSREREELVRWEEKHGRITRSSSTETLKEITRKATQDMAYLTDDASSIGEPSVSGSLPPSPRLNVVVTWEEDEHMSDVHGTNEFSQGWEEVIETTITARRNRQDMGGSLLGPSTLRGHMLALPSIPSTRTSEVNPQSPLTISTPSTPGYTPPASPPPSAPSPMYGSWSESESEDNWLPRETSAPANVPIQFTMPHDPYPRTGPASLRSRSRSTSLSSSSTDSWNDAQSSIGTSSSSWDMLD